MPSVPQPASARQRVLLILGAIAYVALFHWVYLNWLYPQYAYFGYDFSSPAPSHVLLALLLSVLPSFWMPVHLSRPSHLIYWVLYLAVMIPSMLVPVYAGLNESSEVLLLIVTMFLGFVIVGAAHLFSPAKLRAFEISSRRFWIGVFLLTGFFVAWIIAVFRHDLHLVSFMDVYDLRYAANDIMEGSSVNYALMCLSSAVAPLLMGCGLYFKKNWLFAAGLICQLLIYACVGNKGSLLSPVFIVGFFILARRQGAFFLELTWSLVAGAAVLSVIYVLTDKDPGPLQSLILFVVFMRTLSISGLMTAQYYDFFHRNPLTHYSHIKVGSWFATYPYANPIGVEVGSFYSGTTDLDSTAHFWATDGLAALGLPGILLISVFCALLLWAIDSVAEKHDPKLVALLISFAAFNLANISIFTSLLSGGLALLMLLLYLMPKEVFSSEPPLVSPSCHSPHLDAPAV